MGNIMTKLDPLYQSILLAMYDYGLNDGVYNKEKGKLWTNHIVYLVGSDTESVDRGLDTLISYEIIKRTSNQVEKVNDHGVERYIECFVINDTFVPEVKSWYEMLRDTDVADIQWWKK